MIFIDQYRRNQYDHIDSARIVQIGVSVHHWRPRISCWEFSPNTTNHHYQQPTPTPYQWWSITIVIMIKANGQMGWVTVRELWSAGGATTQFCDLSPLPENSPVLNFWFSGGFHFRNIVNIYFASFSIVTILHFSSNFQCCAKLNHVVKLLYKWLCNTLTSISTTNGDETSTLLLFLLLLILKAAKLLLTFIFRFNCFKTVSWEEWFARTPEHQTGKLLNNRILVLRKNAPHALAETTTVYNPSEVLRTLQFVTTVKLFLILLSHRNTPE